MSIFFFIIYALVCICLLQLVREAQSVKQEMLNFFCTESSWGTTVSGGMFYTAAWRIDGISAST